MSKGATIPVKTPEEIQAEPRSDFYAPGKQQIWGCKECRVAKRVWGEGRLDPKSASDEPLIGCKFCRKATRHFYIGTQEGM